MSTPFLGELKIISWNFAPKGWALANGQFLPINQNQALFSILGTTFGGNGQTTFALPDLRGRVPIYTGQGFTLGQAGGQEFHTLTMSEMPQHIHLINAQNAQGNQTNPNFGGAGNLFAQDPGNCYNNSFSPGAAQLNAGSTTNTGGSQPHENRQPFLVLNIIIALQGIFPSRN
jgi:microcystin-dependent protein